MNILHIIRNLEVGGMERMVLTLAAEQVRQGHAVRIFEVEPSRGDRLAVPDGLAVISRRGLWRQVLWAEVIHAHNLVALRAVWLLARLFRRRLVFTKHGMTFPSGLSRWLLARPDAMVAVSRPVYDRYLALLPGVKGHLRYIPNGAGGGGASGQWTVDPPSLQLRRTQQRAQGTQRTPAQGLTSNVQRLTSPPDVLPSPVHCLRFLWVGRMVTEKGLDVLLRAWAAAKLDDARLVLVGDGPEREALAALAEKLAIRDGVQFAGMQQALASYYAAADVFVMPSRTEGLPMALLEAGMAGLPVVVSEVGDMAGIVQESGGGWIVSPGDIDGLKDVLEVAIRCERESLRKKGASLYAHVHANYSAEKMSSDYAALYRELLGKND
ncbi:MAG: glycosyltransferase family 4 protein [Kiritimatiellia bacterium]